MGKIVLDARLAAVAAKVRPGVPVADIGCDHGKLSAFLAQSGKSPYVIAADLRPEPLSKAKDTVRRAGQADKVECRLGNGLSVISAGEVKDIVIAGMGGETIAEILEAAPWTKSEAYHFVFVPATGHPELRRWLYQNGYELCSETPISQGKYWYIIMEVRYTGVSLLQSELFYTLGLHTQGSGKATLGYLRKVYTKLKKELDGKKASGRYLDLAEEEKLCEEVAKEVERCLE